MGDFGTLRVPVDPEVNMMYAIEFSLTFLKWFSLSPLNFPL